MSFHLPGSSKNSGEIIYGVVLDNVGSVPDTLDFSKLSRNFDALKSVKWKKSSLANYIKESKQNLEKNQLYL